MVASWKADPPELPEDPLSWVLLALTAIWMVTLFLSVACALWPATLAAYFKITRDRKKRRMKEEADLVRLLFGKVRHARE